MYIIYILCDNIMFTATNVLLWSFLPFDFSNMAMEDPPCSLMIFLALKL